jgi:hypothetical protein
MNKSHGQRQLSSTRETKPLGSQASKPLVIPIKGEVIQLSGENKQKQRSMDNVWNPFTFLKEVINTRDHHLAWWMNHFVWGRAHIPLGRDGLRKGVTLVAYYSHAWIIVQLYFLSISVNNFTGTTSSTRQAKSLAIHYRLYALTLARWPWFRRAKPQAKRMIQASHLNDRLHCRHCTHEHCSLEHQGNTLVPR